MNGKTELAVATVPTSIAAFRRKLLLGIPTWIYFLGKKLCNYRALHALSPVQLLFYRNRWFCLSPYLFQSSAAWVKQMKSMALSVTKLFPPDTGFSLMMWCGQWEMQLQNSFLFPSHPFSFHFNGNILVVSVNCRNQFIGSTITMNLWMFRFKFSLWSDYISKKLLFNGLIKYVFNYYRCFLNVSILEDYNTWNFASL